MLDLVQAASVKLGWVPLVRATLSSSSKSDCAKMEGNPKISSFKLL